MVAVMTLWEAALHSAIGTPFRQCSKCNLSKPETVSYWYFKTTHKKRLGVSVCAPNGNCRDCTRSIASQWHYDNREYKLAKMRQTRLLFPERFAAYGAASREKHPEKIRERNRDSYERNREERKAYERNKRLADGGRVRAMDNARRRADPEKFREQSRARYAANPEKYSGWMREYRANNPERFREYEKRRYNFDRRIRASVTSKIIKMLRDNGGRKSSIRRLITGWTLDDLLGHLAPLLEEGMSFDNWGTWQIDHVIPVSLIQFSDENDQTFKDVWALSNLAPLWAADNNSKHNRLSWVMPSSYQNERLKETYRNPPMKHLVQGFEGFEVEE